MAAPSWKAVQSNSAANNFGPSTVNVPTNSDGDLLICFAWNYYSSGVRSYNQASWTSLFSTQLTVSGQSQKYQAFYRVASSEPASYDFTHTGYISYGRITIISISGAADPSSIPIVSLTPTAHGASGSATAPSITPTHDESLVLRCSSNKGGTWLDTASISGYTLGYRGYAAASHIVIYDEKNAGATGAESMSYTPTYDSSPAIGHMTLAIAPPAATSFKTYDTYYRHLLGGNLGI